VVRDLNQRDRFLCLRIVCFKETFKELLIQKGNNAFRQTIRIKTDIVIKVSREAIVDVTRWVVNCLKQMVGVFNKLVYAIFTGIFTKGIGEGVLNRWVGVNTN
jgi:hypothetical protein